MNCLKKKKRILFVSFCGVNAPTNPTSLNMRFGREARDLLLGANMSWLSTALVYIPAYTYHGLKGQRSKTYPSVWALSIICVIPNRQHLGELAIYLMQVKSSPPPLETW